MSSWHGVKRNKRKAQPKSTLTSAMSKKLKQKRHKFSKLMSNIMVVVTFNCKHIKSNSYSESVNLSNKYLMYNILEYAFVVYWLNIL